MTSEKEKGIDEATHALSMPFKLKPLKFTIPSYTSRE